MPTLSYSNSAFVTLTVISSSVMNAFFTDITTWANTTKLDYLNLQTAGVRASNVSSQASAAGLPLVSDGAGAATFTNISTIHSGEILNLSLTSTVSSSLLTVNVVTAAGASATATTPIRIGFRNSTANVGTFVDRTITSALTINTVATGCTLGLKSAQNQYIYVYAIDNSGTVELALAGSRAFDEGTTYSTTIINGSSTNALVLYSTTARAGVAVRLIGRLLSNQTTSGTYATAATEISLNTSYTGKQERSEIRLDTSNGCGSGSTKIKRFTTVTKNVGTGLTYTTSADTSVLGSVITINEDGLYGFTYRDNFTGNSALGVTLNSAELTTGINGCTATTILSMLTCGGSGFHTEVSGSVYLQAGDILRAHVQSDNNGGSGREMFRIIKLSS